VFSITGKITEKLLRKFPAGDPAWTYRSPSEATPMPKTGVKGKKLGGKPGRKTDK
jgi:hypothetical protein